MSNTAEVIRQKGCISANTLQMTRFDSSFLWFSLKRKRKRIGDHPRSRAIPGKVSFGTACTPPSLMQRAPYETQVPPSRCLRMAGCVCAGGVNQMAVTQAGG